MSTVVETVILAVTMSGTLPKGRVDVPVTMDFGTRTECMAHFDERMRALRQQLKPPYVVTVSAFCDVKRVVVKP